MHLPHEIIWNASLMKQGNFINVFLARRVSGTYAHVCSADVAARHHPHHTHDLRSGSQDHHTSKNSVLENHMLQLNIWCSWWWVYVPKTCPAKNTLIKLPCCIKLAFQIISIYVMLTEHLLVLLWHYLKYDDSEIYTINYVGVWFHCAAAVTLHTYGIRQ